MLCTVAKQLDPNISNKLKKKKKKSAQTDKLWIYSKSEGETTQKEGLREKGKTRRHILMFVFDRWGMPPIDFVREDRNGG